MKILWITNNFIWDFTNKCHNELLRTCASIEMPVLPLFHLSFTLKHVIAHKIGYVISHLSESWQMDASIVVYMFFNTVIPILLLPFDPISNILKNGKIWTWKFTWILNLHLKFLSLSHDKASFSFSLYFWSVNKNFIENKEKQRKSKFLGTQEILELELGRERKEFWREREWEYYCYWKKSRRRSLHF